MNYQSYAQVTIACNTVESPLLHDSISNFNIRPKATSRKLFENFTKVFVESSLSKKGEHSKFEVEHKFAHRHNQKLNKSSNFELKALIVHVQTAGILAETTAK